MYLPGSTFRSLSAVLFLLATVSCDDYPSQPRVSGSSEIGPEGGVVESQNGLAELDVPAGALDEMVSMSLVVTSASVIDPLQVAETVYALQPQTITLLAPATMWIEYDPAFLQGGGEGSLRIHRMQSQGWTTSGVLHVAVDATQNRVIARVTQGGVYAILQ